MTTNVYSKCRANIRTNSQIAVKILNPQGTKEMNAFDHVRIYFLTSDASVRAPQNNCKMSEVQDNGKMSKVKDTVVTVLGW